MAQQQQQPASDPFLWAKEPIFMRINAEMKKTGKSVDTLFKNATIKSDPTKINRKNFLLILKRLDTQIAVQDIDALTRLLVDSSGAVDLALFYKVYALYTEGVEKAAQIVIDKLLMLIANYLQDQSLPSLAEYLDAVETDVNGTRKKTLDEGLLDDFLTKQLPAVSPEERNQFKNTFRLSGLHNKLDIEEMDRQIAAKRPHEEVKVPSEERKAEPPVPESKTYESMMEQVRLACALTFSDIYQVFKELDIAGAQLIGKAEFEEGLRKINVAMDSEDIEKLFVILDEDRDSKISYLDLATNLEKYSLESPKAISQRNDLHPIFLRIRQYIKDRKGMGLQKVFRREMMKTQKGRLYLQSPEFRNGLTAMKIFLDNTMYRQLEKFLDVGNKGMIDFLFFCENLGYIHRPDTEVVGRYGSGAASSIRGMNSNIAGVSSVMGVVDQGQFIKAFLLRLSKAISDQKVDLDNRFMEYDMTGTGVVDMAEFRWIVEKVAKEFSGSQLRKVAEKYAVPNQQDRINYRAFLEDMTTTCRKVRIINKAFACLYRYKIEARQDDLFVILEGCHPGEDKTFNMKQFADFLDEYCQISLTDQELDMVIKEFDTRGTGKVDLYEFVSQYKEYEKRNEDQGNIKRPDPEVIKDVLSRLRDYCDKYGVILMDLFNKYNTGDRRMTQFEFHTALRDLAGDTQLTEDAIHQMSAEITDIHGGIDLNQICRMYNEYFGRSEETLDAVQTKREVENLLRKIVSQALKLKRPVEDVLYAHDRERYGTITRADMMDILRRDFELEDERPETLRRLLDIYDPGKDGIVKYMDLLNDLKLRLEEQMGCQRLLSKLKGHLIVNGIYIHDKFIVEDFLHEKFLQREQIHKILRVIGFNTSEFVVDQVLNQFSKDINGKINYVEFEDAIRAAADVFFEDEQAPMIRPEHIVPSAEVMDVLGRKVAANRIHVEELMSDHDYSRAGRLPYDKFVEILLALQAKNLNKYDVEGLADHYADAEKKSVDYRMFVPDLEMTAKKYEVQNDKTGLQWAEPTLEEIAILLYARGKDCSSYFEECGYGGKTVSREEFATGLERLGVRTGEVDLGRMMRELDKEGNATVNVRELGNLVAIKSYQARAKYERTLFQKIFDFVQTHNTDVVGIFRQHDNEATNLISLSDFTNEVQLYFGELLDLLQKTYLLQKYTTNVAFANYPAFVEDIRRCNAMVRLGDDMIAVLDKLRSGVQRLQLDLVAYFAKVDRANKGVLPTSLMAEAFPPELLTGEEQTSLAGLLDPYQQGTFEYRKLLELLWIEDVDPKTKEAAAHALTQELAMYCKTKNIDLESQFIRLSKDKTGYLSSDELKQGFDAVGVKLSYSQLSALLYYQPISTDVAGRKSFIDLLVLLFGSTTADKRLALIAEQSAAKRGPNGQTDLAATGSGGNVQAEGDQPTIQMNPLEAYRSYHPEAYSGYRSIFQRDLMQRILKYVLSSRINLPDHFKTEDPTNTGFVSKKAFFDILGKVSIELDEKEQNEVLMLPGVLENLYEVHYMPFINCLMEKDYQLRKEGGLQDLMLQGHLLPPSPLGSQGGESVLPAQLAAEVKELSLTEDELQYVTGLLKALRLNLENGGHNVEETFGKLDVANTGTITLIDFIAVLKQYRFQFADPLQLSMMYSYLKEKEKNAISLQRLYNAVLRGKVMSQYRSATQEEYMRNLSVGLQNSSLAIVKLTQFMRTNGIAPAAFREFAKTGGGRSISHEEFYAALRGINFPAQLVEADSIFSAIENPKTGRGSVPKLVDLLAERQGDAVSSRIDPAAQRTLEKINDHLKEKGGSLDDFAASLDVNKDGYISYEEFADGVMHSGVSATKEELTQLAQIIDANGYVLLP